MSDKSILQRYGGRNGDPAHLNSSPSEIEGSDDLGCFGWLRGIRDRALSLELRKKTGNIVAIPYSWIDRFEFDPSEGITLSVPGRTIKITGRNLNAEVRPMVRLFEGIARNRVPWIQEADEPERIEADDTATVIDGIEW